MAQDTEKFLSRWSRLKSGNKLPEKTESASDESPAPVLPSVDDLTPESDFTGFMHPKVEDALRRVALKKLFRDPHFNVPDPFEPYSRDFNVAEPISEEMLASLNQARTLIFGPKENGEEGKKPDDEAKLVEEKPKDDDAGSKDA